MPEQSVVREERSAKAVRAMYEHYPYPSPTVGDTLIEDVANALYSLFGEQPLDSWKILDAGCGTGHRLVATARRYPEAQFIGLDMTAASLDVARRLTHRHKVTNVHLEQGDVLNLNLSDKFDLVISTGVIVCLEDPQQGLQSLAAVLAPGGVLMVWLYDAVGEHLRMLDRELLHMMWDADSGLQVGVQTMRDLGLQLEAKQYGSSSSQRSDEVSQLNIDVDAYVHPIVNVYRFDEAVDMFRNCRELGWAAINNINLVGTSKLIDLAEAERPEMRYFCQSVEDLFPKDSLRKRFREFGKMEKLRAMEIKLRPTGFTIVGGRDRSYAKLGRRIAGNVLEF